MNKGILIQQLRVFAMLQRIEELRPKNTRVLIIAGGRSHSVNAMMLKMETEPVPFERFEPSEYLIEQPAQINRASRRGQKESKRKKNFNHYNQ